MKLMELIQLNQENLSSLATHISCPNYERSSIKTGVVHIGVGGFHRSHQAYYMHQLLEDPQNANWGICGIGLREGDRKIASVLKQQDGLYTLITQHPDGKETSEIIGSITDFIFAYESPVLAIDKMAHSDTKIVSLTITEGGYNFDTNTGNFNFDTPDIEHDLQHPNTPKTVFGFLTTALRKRRDNGLAPFTILSCDNIQHNGEVTRKMLLSFVQEQDPSLCKWIEKEVCFPNSMVDRITPVTPDASIDFLKKKYHLKDDWPIVCEPFIQWVIEDDFSNGRPPLEKLGVHIVADVTPYEKMKIRLLNSGHSVLGIPGALHGYQTINACMEDPLFASFMRAFMDKEVSPLLDKVDGIDLTAYKNSLEERFANPNIKDGVSRICSESSAKLPKFLLPTLLENLQRGGSIKYASFVLAAWCYYSDKGVDLNNSRLEIIDYRKEELHQSANQTQQDPLSFLRLTSVFGDLLENKRFISLYTTYIKTLYNEPNIHKQLTAIHQDNF